MQELLIVEDRPGRILHQTVITDFEGFEWQGALRVETAAEDYP